MLTKSLLYGRFDLESCMLAYNYQLLHYLHQTKSFESMCYNFVPILFKKCFDRVVVPATKENNGSGGSFNIGNLTLPLKQHIPGPSLLNFNALQCVQTLFIVLTTRFRIMLKYHRIKCYYLSQSIHSYA
jgi:hypothetical protein